MAAMPTWAACLRPCSDLAGRSPSPRPCHHPHAPPTPRPEHGRGKRLSRTELTAPDGIPTADGAGRSRSRSAAAELRDHAVKSPLCYYYSSASGGRQCATRAGWAAACVLPWSWRVARARCCCRLVNVSCAARAADDSAAVCLRRADDMGWGDWSRTGAPADTPELDAMSRSPSAVWFHRAYSGNPICSPTRCASPLHLASPLQFRRDRN